MVLKEVATRLRNVVRDEDMVMRWGGEEFLIYSQNRTRSKLPTWWNVYCAQLVTKPELAGNMPSGDRDCRFISVPFSDVPEDVWIGSVLCKSLTWRFTARPYGRNRAYGLSRLLVPHEDAIPTLTRSCCRHQTRYGGMIEVLGPFASSKSSLVVPYQLNFRSFERYSQKKIFAKAVRIDIIYSNIETRFFAHPGNARYNARSRDFLRKTLEGP